MKKLEYVIQKEEGLHMKEAVEFVDMTEEFRSEIEVEKKEVRMVSGKSLLGIISLIARKGDRLYVTVQGEDEEEAAEAIQKFVIKTNLRREMEREFLRKKNEAKRNRPKK